MAEIYLLDSDTYMFISDGNPQVMASLQGIALDDEVFINFVTVGEWEYGYHNARSARSKAEIRAAGDEAFNQDQQRNSIFSRH